MKIGNHLWIIFALTGDSLGEACHPVPNATLLSQHNPLSVGTTSAHQLIDPTKTSTGSDALKITHKVDGNGSDQDHHCLLCEFQKAIGSLDASHAVGSQVTKDIADLTRQLADKEKALQAQLNNGAMTGADKQRIMHELSDIWKLQKRLHGKKFSPSRNYWRRAAIPTRIIQNKPIVTTMPVAVAFPVQRFAPQQSVLPVIMRVPAAPAPNINPSPQAMVVPQYALNQTPKHKLKESIATHSKKTTATAGINHNGKVNDQNCTKKEEIKCAKAHAKTASQRPGKSIIKKTALCLKTVKKTCLKGAGAGANPGDSQGKHGEVQGNLGQAKPGNNDGNKLNSDAMAVDQAEKDLKAALKLYEKVKEKELKDKEEAEKRKEQELNDGIKKAEADAKAASEKQKALAKELEELKLKEAHEKGKGSDDGVKKDGRNDGDHTLKNAGENGSENMPQDEHDIFAKCVMKAKYAIKSNVNNAHHNAMTSKKLTKRLGKPDLIAVRHNHGGLVVYPTGNKKFKKNILRKRHV